jgi:hypothetical protein
LWFATKRSIFQLSQRVEEVIDSPPYPEARALDLEVQAR